MASFLTLPITISFNDTASAPAWQATTDSTWLSLDTYAGTGPATVMVSADPSGLLAGTYTGNVTITADVSGSPQVVAVTFKVSGNMTPDSLTVPAPEPVRQLVSVPAAPQGAHTVAMNVLPAAPRAARTGWPLLALLVGGIAALPARFSGWKRRGTSLLVLLFCLFAVPASAETIKYYTTDGVGNVRVVTDESGAVIERHDYLPFGEECTTGACASNPGVGAGQPRKFTGKERDTETGLDYFGARYYGSRTARFTAVDPKINVTAALVDPQRWNRYAYARNNPLALIDPNGKDIEVVVTFRGYTPAETAAVLAAMRGYLSRAEVGNVVVRADSDADSRTFGQRLRDWFPGSGYYTITSDADKAGDSTNVSEFRGGDLGFLRDRDPQSYATRTADGVLHEVLAHQASIGKGDDTVSMGYWPPDSVQAQKQLGDPYFQTRQGTLMDHIQCRSGTGACQGNASMKSVRGLHGEDEKTLKKDFQPIERSYK